MSIKIHFMGIGGSGASAAAAIAQSQGYQVTGCDKNPFNEFTKNLDQSSLLEGHSASHLKDSSVDLLVISPAITSLDPNNEEIQAAKDKGIPVLTWQEFMGKYLEQDKFVIAVCGTHGKSTTTAMIGKLLEDAGLDPTVELGAIVHKWGKNYRVGKSRYFVTESDEFNDNFLFTCPDIAVVTIVEMDHPEYFKDFEAYKNSFRKFFSQTKQTIIANLSNQGVKDVLASLEDVWRGKTIDYSNQFIDFPLQIPGEFNILNASAAYQVGLKLGIDPELITQSLKSFEGIGRRFELIGNFQGAKVYSDFGHHPTEIKVTLQAARNRFPDNKIITVFQPHMFSRTHFLFNDFVRVIKDLPVDTVFILDIYPSREVDTGLVTSKQLAEAVGKDSVKYLNSVETLKIDLKKEADDRTVIFFIGAGDTDKWARELVEDK